MISAILLFVVAAGSQDLVVGSVETVGTEYKFVEGPLWISGKGLIFSDIPANSIYNADKTPFRSPSGESNGLTLDRQGRLIVCEGANRRVSRTEADGAVSVVADKYLGRKLNSPNDVVVRSDGAVFFTDPTYGLNAKDAELPFSGVYAVTPDGKVTLLSVYFKFPNGLTFSPDEKTLYVGESEAGFIEAFDVAPDCSLSNARTFATGIGADGMKTDSQGRLWTSAKDGIRVYAPSGQLLKTIAFPEQPSNCAFGDDDAMTLYVTARTSVYKIRCAAPGILPGK
jgi:gluconolactonase